MSTTPAFTRIVQSFFQEYLVAERGLSSNTVLSYRDTVRLYVQFTDSVRGRGPDELSLEDLDAKHVRDFLDWIETKRSCCPRTRNQRLAALKTLARYVASLVPEHIDRCRQIREIANKRVQHKPPSYLEPDQLRSLFAGLKPDAPNGLRDLALVTLMVNTGARVQEVVTLDVADVTLTATPKVRLRGKGGKDRDCPLWSRTADLLARWIRERSNVVDPRSPLFLNARGQRLTRWGVAHILARRVELSAISKSRGQILRVTPHTLRHTTAMELLRANVDITVISAWLGHATLSTTYAYMEIDLRMKQGALDSTKADFLPRSIPANYPKPSLVRWLENLGKSPDYVESRAGRFPNPRFPRVPASSNST